MDAGAAFWEERGEGAAATLGKFANDWGRNRKLKFKIYELRIIQNGVRGTDPVSLIPNL